MQKVTVKVTCYLPRPKDAAETKLIRVTLNGSSFEIDAGDDDVEKVSAPVAPFISAADQKASAKPKPQASTRSGEKHARAVRRWAAAHGVPVGARGRIPARVESAYAADQAGLPPEPGDPAEPGDPVDSAPPVVLREPAVDGAASIGGDAGPGSARNPRVSKSAGEATARATAV
jgi:Lsr2